MQIRRKKTKKKEKEYPFIYNWISGEKIKNEKGDRIDLIDHQFLFDIYHDQSDKITVMKGAQVGLSTLSILKNHFDAKRYKMDIIYTLPTDKDVGVFVGGKVNRIIANNESMLEDVADKDSIEQKQVGKSMIYFRGTWTKKAAIMVTADRLVHDEKDSSKLDVVAEYQARLQHSKFKQIHTFSHPSLPETGVHYDWLQSDQKHWFIKCPQCSFWQYMSWDLDDPSKMSVDIKKGIYVCKKCHGEIDQESRINGQWVAKYKNKEWSGYWVSMLIAPWVTAKEIVRKWKDPQTTEEFFYQKVLGLPWADGSSKLLRADFLKNLTGKNYAPTEKERIVIGIDTGLKLDYVMGNDTGLFFHGEAKDYDELDAQMRRWPRAIAIIDQGGDLIGSRKFYEAWPGRVFLCSLGGDRKTKELAKWPTKDESGTVQVDRNRIVQLVIDEFREGRIPVHGNENDWYEYWLDWNNLSKLKVLDPDTNETKGYKWVRAGRDHRAMATVFWRVGMSRFSRTGKIYTVPTESRPNSYMVNPNDTVDFDPKEFFDKREDLEEKDWRE